MYIYVGMYICMHMRAEHTDLTYSSNIVTFARQTSINLEKDLLT